MTGYVTASIICHKEAVLSGMSETILSFPESVCISRLSYDGDIVTESTVIASLYGDGDVLRSLDLALMERMTGISTFVHDLVGKILFSGISADIGISSETDDH